MRIFNEGELNSTQKAIDIMLSMDVNSISHDRLFGMLSHVKLRREFVAVYLFMLSFLCERKDETRDHARWGVIDEENSPVVRCLTPEAGSIYYYLLKIEESRRRGGALRSEAARSVAISAAAMDESNRGTRGYSDWFTDFRRSVHDSPGKHLLPYVRDILLSWKGADLSGLAGLEKKRIEDMNNALDKGFRKTMRGMISALISELNEQGYRVSNEECKFPDDILKVGEEACIAAIEKIKTDKTAREADKLYGMIRMYYALDEQYGGEEAKVIPVIKGENMSIGQLDFMKEEHTALCLAIDKGDPLTILRHLAACRQMTREHLMTYKEDRTDCYSTDMTRDRLMELDYNMHLAGRDIMAEIPEIFNNCKTAGDIKALVPALAAMGRFIHAYGLGGIEFEQLLKELDEGGITYSQLHDLVRALRTEAHKIARKMNEDVRCIAQRFLPRMNFMDLTEEWQRIARSAERIVKEAWGMGTARDINDEERERIETSIIDTLVQDSTLPVFDSALMQTEAILGTGFTPENDALPDTSALPACEPIPDQFFRFGQNDVIPRNELLSKWSKKGLNLVKMTQMGMPVPPGVILSAGLLKHPEIFKSPEFREQVENEIAEIRKHSKYPDLKLLLYARSGSAFTLPGLLATIPNVGMNDAEAASLAASSGDAWFAYDTYAEFLRSYAINIFGIPRELFDEEVNIYDKDMLSPEQMKEVCGKYKRIIETRGKGAVIPENIIDQVMLAIDAVYGSWDSRDAREYRARHKISQEWGSVVILQKGVFGNLNTTEDGRVSGSGAAALRTFPDGRDVLQGKFRYRSIGDQLMSRAEQNYILMSNSEKQFENEQTLEELEPELYQRLLIYAYKLREIFGNNQHFEFTVEMGNIWLTQTNDDIVRDEYPEFGETDDIELIGRGHGVSGGALRGWVAGDTESANVLLEKYEREKPEGIDGVILFLDRVSPEMINKVPRGLHIVARTISVHAETLAQKEGITAVYGVVGMKRHEEDNCWYIGSRKMPDGMAISIDGHENGLLYHHSGGIFSGIVPLAKKTTDETEVERRSRRALSMASRMRDRELREEVMRKRGAALTLFEKEVLRQFAAYARGEKERKDIIRYLQNYRTVLDKAARAFEDIGPEPAGPEFKAAVTEKLDSLGLSFDLFSALEKHCFPLSEANREALRSVMHKLSIEPPAADEDGETVFLSAAGGEVKLRRTAGGLFEPPSVPLICNRPAKPVKLVSFEIDGVLDQWMYSSGSGYSEITSLFKALKNRGLEVVISTANPRIENIMDAWSEEYPEIGRYLDGWHCGAVHSGLEQYVTDKGYERGEIMHLGNNIFGEEDIHPSSSAYLHKQGFVAIMVGQNLEYEVKAGDVFKRRVDGYIPALTTHEDLLLLIGRWVKGYGFTDDPVLPAGASRPLITEKIKSDAEETGLSIPTNIYDGRYTLLVDYSLYKNGEEYDMDRRGYTAGNKHAGFGDRFNVETADTSNIDNLLAHIRAMMSDKKNPVSPGQIIVKVPCEFSDDALEKLKAEALGIRILRVDTTELKSIEDDEERRDLRFDLYAMMLSARGITAGDLACGNAVYRTLGFFLNTHYGDGEEDISKDLIAAIVSGDLRKVIKYDLSFRPSGKWAKPEYHIVSVTLVSA
ncbi:MAG: hypothetical protein ABH883_06920 [Candidatus Omnitrophota bacterium]